MLIDKVFKKLKTYKDGKLLSASGYTVPVKTLEVMPQDQVIFYGVPIDEHGIVNPIIFAPYLPITTNPSITS